MTGIERLHDIMTRLRNPETGCPWDRVQTLETLKPCVLEEGKQCTFCGKCMKKRETSNEPKTATEAAEYYNSLILEPSGRWSRK